MCVYAHICMYIYIYICVYVCVCYVYIYMYTVYECMYIMRALQPCKKGWRQKGYSALRIHGTRQRDLRFARGNAIFR